MSKATTLGTPVLPGWLVGPRFDSAFIVGIATLVAACGTNIMEPMPPQPGNEQPPGFFPTTPITEQGLLTENLYLITFVIA